MAERNLKIEEIIASGEVDVFLGHLADSDLSVRDIDELLAQASEAAAGRKNIQAKLVVESVSGVEHLVPNAGHFESEKAGKLLELSKKFRATRSSR